MTNTELKSILISRGIKQTFVAHHLGVSKQLVYKWVKGTLPISKRHHAGLKYLFNPYTSV